MSDHFLCSNSVQTNSKEEQRKDEQNEIDISLRNIEVDKNNQSENDSSLKERRDLDLTDTRIRKSYRRSSGMMVQLPSLTRPVESSLSFLEKSVGFDDKNSKSHETNLDNPTSLHLLSPGDPEKSYKTNEMEFNLLIAFRFDCRDQHVRQRAAVRCRTLPRSAAKRKIFDDSPRAAQRSARFTAHRTAQRKFVSSIYIQLHSLPIDLYLKILSILQKSGLALQIGKSSLSSNPLDF